MLTERSGRHAVTRSRTFANAYRLGVYLPLAGVRIVDASSVIMGPLGTQVLADLGADVIVIEDRRGDTNRAMGIGGHPELSGPSMNLMRNKRSVGLDFKSQAGYEVLERLVTGADVFVTNLRPGSRERARLTYEDLRQFRADLVYCAAAGYPIDSALADAPAYDDIIQAASGVVDLAQRVGLPPVLMPTLIADKVTGLVIAQAITAALFHHARTGEGQEIQIAMSEAMRAFMLVEHGANAIPVPPTGSSGYSRILTSERRPQPTLDGLINVLPYDKAHYQALFRMGGRDDLIDDPRLATRQSRILHGETLYRDAAAILATRTTGDWMTLLREAGIPCTEVATIDDLLVDLPVADHPHAGAYRVTPPVVGSFDGTEVVRRPAPLHGEHGREVLSEIGYSTSEIDEFERSGVLFSGMS